MVPSRNVFLNAEEELTDELTLYGSTVFTGRIAATPRGATWIFREGNRTRGADEFGALERPVIAQYNWDNYFRHIFAGLDLRNGSVKVVTVCSEDSNVANSVLPELVQHVNATHVLAAERKSFSWVPAAKSIENGPRTARDWVDACIAVRRGRDVETPRVPCGYFAETPRPRRGHAAETGRGDAATAATLIFCGDDGRDVDQVQPDRVRAVKMDPRHHRGNMRVIEDFTYLTRAKRLIVTESTFAWWAAFLGNADEIHAPGSGRMPVPAGEPRYVFHDMHSRQYWGRYDATRGTIVYADDATTEKIYRNWTAADLQGCPRGKFGMTGGCGTA